MSYLPSVRGQDGRLLTNHNRNSTLLPSGRDSNIKMGCSIGLLILKFSEIRGIEFRFKSRSSSTSNVLKTLD